MRARLGLQQALNDDRIGAQHVALDNFLAHVAVQEQQTAFGRLEMHALSRAQKSPE